MEMSFKLRLVLLLFSLIWIFGIVSLIKKEKISIKNSILWFATGFLILIIALFPAILELISRLFGFLTMSNLVIGILISILLILILRLTIIVTEQKEQIRSLVQEVSILRGKVNKK